MIRFCPREFKVEVCFKTKTTAWSEGDIRVLRVLCRCWEIFMWGIEKTKEYEEFFLQRKKWLSYKNEKFDVLYPHILSDLESIRRGRKVLLLGSTDKVSDLKDAIALVKNQSFRCMYNLVDKKYYKVLKQPNVKYKYVLVKLIEDDNI